MMLLPWISMALDRVRDRVDVNDESGLSVIGIVIAVIIVAIIVVVALVEWISTSATAMPPATAGQLIPGSTSDAGAAANGGALEVAPGGGGLARPSCART